MWRSRTCAPRGGTAACSSGGAGAQSTTAAGRRRSTPCRPGWPPPPPRPARQQRAAGSQGQTDQQIDPERQVAGQNECAARYLNPEPAAWPGPIAVPGIDPPGVPQHPPGARPPARLPKPTRLRASRPKGSIKGPSDASCQPRPTCHAPATRP
jgi:hypothetical protein